MRPLIVFGLLGAPQIGPHGIGFAPTAWAAGGCESEDAVVTWAPAAVNATVALGTSTTVNVSFSSSCPLGNVVLRSGGVAARFLSAIASTNGVTLTFSAPANATLGTYSGRLAFNPANDDDTIPKVLPITLQVVKQTQVSAQGATVVVPTGFQSDATSTSLGGPVSLNNFGGRYLEAGFVPQGGATMRVGSVPLPIPPLDDFIYRDLRGATITSTTFLTVAGSSCTEQFYTIVFGPAASYSNVAVYCPYGTHLYRLQLSYRAGDALEAQFLSAFQQLINTVTFS